ncbi:MAG TPA: DUF4167 domain-containing protein [Dongiaceae bacterium]|nr:DUF4167 domain-containing protein [Dongiaceae bacterium]
MRQTPNPRRPRGRGPRKPHGAPHQQGFEGGAETRVRGNAYQVLEKYLTLAREANSAGDRVAAENFLQHAEHYYRVINATADQRGQNGRHRPGGRRDNGTGPNGAEATPEAGGDGAAGEAEDTPSGAA